jgi:arginyl-tRNA synthetase
MQKYFCEKSEQPSPPAPLPEKGEGSNAITRNALRHLLWQTLQDKAKSYNLNISSIRINRPKRRDVDFAVNQNSLPIQLADLTDALASQLIGYKIAIENNYLNFSMNNSLLQTQIDEALQQGAAFGAQDQWSGRRVSVEFVSADPIGPLSVQRGRIAVCGDALCRLLKWQGASVTREYLINDDESSSRLNLLGESILSQYAAIFGTTQKPPEGALDTPFVREVAKQIAERDGNRYLLLPAEEVAKTFAGDACRRAIRSHQRSLEALDVHFDLWVYETALINEGRLEAAINRLRENEAIYDRDGIVWIATSKWGDATDRSLTRKSGTPTYLASDIAYHLYRFERGYDTLINIWSDEHGQYVERTHAALAAAGFDPDRLKVLLCAPLQWTRDGVELPENESPSTTDEALALFDAATLRLALLIQNINQPATLDLELLSYEDTSNPVYELLLLPARLAMLQREADAQSPNATGEWNEVETDLARWVALWSETVETATTQLSPQRIAVYLQDGAKLTEKLLAAHRAGQSLDARLLKAASQVAANGFAILGVEAAEKL